MEEEQEEIYGSEDENDRSTPKRQTKVRDIFTDRVVGIIGGAFIPVVLLFIPLANKYLDNSKEIRTLQIQNNTEDIEIAKQRLSVLTEALINSQLQLKTMMDKLTLTIKNLDDCQNDLKKRGTN